MVIDNAYDALERYRNEQAATEELRKDVVLWLRRHINMWPKEQSQTIRFDVEYKRFRFVECDDGEIVFGDCIHPAITEKDFYDL